MNALLTQTAFSTIAPDFRPYGDATGLLAKSAPIPQGEFWDEAANYIGAIRPGSRVTRLENWTAFPEH